MPDYSIVGRQGRAAEYDGNGTTKVTYNGTGGVSLGNFFTRLAFAVNYKETNFLLNDAVSAKGAKIIFNRDPRQTGAEGRAVPEGRRRSVPDRRSATGHIVWMVDGYTTMSNYPYSRAAVAVRR